ncbi:MAG: hypothetical protein PW843_10770 [Azospirillaceae bacterium]|nr:hypothetical protein [Azospirillaceae bacterium]
MMGKWHGWALTAALVLCPAPSWAKPRSITVQTVVVEETGLFRPQQTNIESEEVCGRFRPSDAQVLAWLAKAKEVSAPAFYETATITQCSAKGHLSTTSGKTYPWILDPGGGIIIETSARDAIYLKGPQLPLR